MKKSKGVTLGRAWRLLGVMAVLGLAFGCGEVGGGGQCGGAGNAGACVKIESIQPTYAGGPTTDVDAFQDACFDASGVFTNFEPFTDHAATFTFSNKPLPNAPTDTVFDVTLTRFTIEYQLNACPSGESCPDLGTVEVSKSLFISANGSLTVDLKFVDIAKRLEYQNLGGTPGFTGGPPSYTAVYTFIGTDIFNREVAVSGSTEFTIGDYDNCGA